MQHSDGRGERFLEMTLVFVTAGLACLLYSMTGMKVVVLNLFYLPVVLAGFFLGRYRAGVLALLSVISATIVVATDLRGFSAQTTPIMIALAVTFWGSSLGLTSILVGTLSDQRDTKALEAHEAHIGVMEVLARYLQSANPDLEHRALEVARLSARVAEGMRLSSKELDDIRVAALLLDMENIEITARVIRKAVDELEDDAGSVRQRTFNGTELVRSLGTALRGAFPLLLAQSTHGADHARTSTPFGARIIRTVRAYVQLLDRHRDSGSRGPLAAISELRRDSDAEHDPAVLHALETVVLSDNGGGPGAAGCRTGAERFTVGA